jgi:hypothetical protein
MQRLSGMEREEEMRDIRSLASWWAGNVPVVGRAEVLLLSRGAGLELLRLLNTLLHWLLITTLNAPTTRSRSHLYNHF